MKNKTRILVASLVVLILALSIVVVAQVNRPFRNGTVWDIGFIKMKPGMETAYLNYVATELGSANRKRSKKTGRSFPTRF